MVAIKVLEEVSRPQLLLVYPTEETLLNGSKSQLFARAISLSLVQASSSRWCHSDKRSQSFCHCLWIGMGVGGLVLLGHLVEGVPTSGHRLLYRKHS